MSTTFETVTLTGAEVVVFGAASRARAVSVWAPFAVAVVSHETEYGDVVSSAPRLFPSSRNCTPTTPTLSDGVRRHGHRARHRRAGRRRRQRHVGGGVVSAFDDRHAHRRRGRRCSSPRHARRARQRVRRRSVAVAVSHDTEYGAVVSSAPRLFPSSRNCTPTRPRCPTAFADTVTEPDTVAPPLGAVSDTDGAVVSAFDDR